MKRQGEGFGKKVKLNRPQKCNIVSGPLSNMKRQRKGFCKKAKMNQPQKYNILNSFINHTIRCNEIISQDKLVAIGC